MKHFWLLICLLGPIQGWCQLPQEGVFGQSTTRDFIREKYKLEEYGLALRACREAGDNFPEADFRQTYFRMCSSTRRFEEGIKAYETWYPQLGGAPTALRSSYFRFLLLNNDFKAANRLLDRRGFFTSSTQSRLMLESALLQNNRKAVDTLIEQLQLAGASQIQLLRNLQAEELALKRKRPWVGGLLSTALPGMGQVYAKQPGDGLSSFLMVGISVFGAYRLFDKKGTGNVLAWGLSGLGASFYLANIWGGRRAVQRYNHHLGRKYRSHVEDLVRTGI